MNGKKETRISSKSWLISSQKTETESVLFVLPVIYTTVCKNKMEVIRFPTHVNAY